MSQARIYSSLGHTTSPPTMPPLPDEPLHIAYRNIRYPSAQAPVLNKADFILEPGVTLLLGANGSGKTTLLNLIMGVIPAVIPAEYSEIIGLSEEARQAWVGYVPQGNEISLFYDTVSRALCHLPEVYMRTWMERFGLLDLLEGEKMLNELSAGECKVVALIAELLEQQHKVCLLDEPSAFLSEAFKQQLHKLLCEVAADGKRILIATHDLDMIPLANNFLLLQDGLLQQIKAPIPMKVPYLCSSLPVRNRIPLLTFNVPQPLLPYDSIDNYDTENMRKLTFSRFDRIGFCGSNGAGKTTLGRFILNNSKCVRTVMMWQALEKQLFTSTVMDELLVGTEHSPQSHEEAKCALKSLEMEHLAEKAPQFLSGGEKRALLVLCLVMQHPDILILDEVFDSVDVHRATLLAKFINCYQQQSGCCCVFIDQNIEPLSTPIDRVYTIRNFQIDG